MHTCPGKFHILMKFVLNLVIVVELSVLTEVSQSSL